MRSDGPAQIEWRCPLCLHQEFLSGFDSNRWDLSSSGFAAAGRGEVEERVSFDEFSALLAAPALGGVFDGVYLRVGGPLTTQRGVRVLALLLMFGLWPGAAELTVDAWRMVIAGHTHHEQVCSDVASTDFVNDIVAVVGTDSDAGEHDGHGHEEHQCSALFHLCGCHAPPPTTATTVTTVAPTRWSELAIEPVHTQGLALMQAADGSAVRTTRPPIA